MNSEETASCSDNQIPIYPPTDPQLLIKMCQYLREKKAVPMTTEEIRAPSSPIPKTFIPRETVCNYCKTPLGKPIKITGRASVLTMRGMFEGVETFFKQCTNCKMAYRYQEWEDGLHNYNDNFLLGLDVCKFLRDCLQQHLPIGSIVNVLGSQIVISK